MRVGVTGSTGLVGTAVVAALVEAGHTPVRFVRRTNPGDHEIIEWDPQAGSIDSDGLERLDGVVHLAGESIASSRWTDSQKQKIRASRADGTRLLAETIASVGSSGPTVLVSGSAIGYYGDRGDDTLTEQSSKGEGFLADVCEDWEAAAEPARRVGVRVVHPRLGIVLAEHDGALAEQLPFFKVGLGGRIGSGRQWWSWVTIDDTAAALVWMLESELSGPVNVTAPEPSTNAEFTSALGSVLRRPTVLPTPKPVLWAKLGRELTEALLYTSARVLPEALLDDGFTFSHSRVEPALRAVLGPSNGGSEQ